MVKMKTVVTKCHARSLWKEEDFANTVGVGHMVGQMCPPKNIQHDLSLKLW